MQLLWHLRQSNSVINITFGTSLGLQELSQPIPLLEPFYEIPIERHSHFMGSGWALILTCCSCASLSDPVQHFQRSPGQTMIATRIKQQMGASENKENRPNSCAVTIARGTPTTISKRPAVKPVTHVHSLAPIRMDTVTTPQPSMANQCIRCTRLKNGAPMVMMRLKLAIPFIKQKTQAMPARKPTSVRLQVSFPIGIMSRK